MKLNIKILSQKFLHSNHKPSFSYIRFMTTQESVERRHHLFTLEKKRQLENVGRIEKIEVHYKGIPKDCTLLMNKDISTPYDCAKHLGQWHTEASALAIIDESVYWDMHRPLTDSCVLELRTYNIPDPQQIQQVNKAYWRTCSLLLGACATIAFKDNVTVKLHSFPSPDIRRGSFIYDIDLPTLPDWNPTTQELYTLSGEYIKLCRQNLNVERLEVTQDLALEMFKENEHKSQQIPSIASQSGTVTLYRVGQHVDISKGPMISNTRQVGRATIAAVHKLVGSSSNSNLKQLYRFQGVSLPTGMTLNHFGYNILVERAKKLNTARSTFGPFTEPEKSQSDEEQESVAANV